MWGTDPVFSKVDGETYYYVNDNIGTSQMVYDQSGSPVWEGVFSAFGETMDLRYNGVTNPLRFAGQYFDAETGLHYNWHRYYAPELGRYTSMDPLGIWDGLNTYAYAGSNPVSIYDPYGLYMVTGTPGGGVPNPLEALRTKFDRIVNSIDPAVMQAGKDLLGGYITGVTDGLVDGSKIGNPCSALYGVGSFISNFIGPGGPLGKGVFKAARKLQKKRKRPVAALWRER